jgi:hypothetical protein
LNDDFWRFVSASKNSVPGQPALDRSPRAVAPEIPTFGPRIRDIGSIQKYNFMTHRIAFIPFDLIFRNNNSCSNYRGAVVIMARRHADR